jgi:hypothetical protein
MLQNARAMIQAKTQERKIGPDQMSKNVHTRTEVGADANHIKPHRNNAGIKPRKNQSPDRTRRNCAFPGSLTGARSIRYTNVAGMRERAITSEHARASRLFTHPLACSKLTSPSTGFSHHQTAVHAAVFFLSYINKLEN